MTTIDTEKLRGFMLRMQAESAKLQTANAHDPSFVDGLRCGTNTYSMELSELIASAETDEDDAERRAERRAAQLFPPVDLHALRKSDRPANAIAEALAPHRTAELLCVSCQQPAGTDSECAGGYHVFCRACAEGRPARARTTTESTQPEHISAALPKYAACIDCGIPCDPTRNPLRCLVCELDSSAESIAKVAQDLTALCASAGCDECGDELTAMQACAAEMRLCACSHPESAHVKEGTDACRKCDCAAFELPTTGSDQGSSISSVQDAQTVLERMAEDGLFARAEEQCPSCGKLAPLTACKKDGAACCVECVEAEVRDDQKRERRRVELAKRDQIKQGMRQAQAQQRAERRRS